MRRLADRMLRRGSADRSLAQASAQRRRREHALRQRANRTATRRSRPPWTPRTTATRSRSARARSRAASRSPRASAWSAAAPGRRHQRRRPRAHDRRGRAATEPTVSIDGSTITGGETQARSVRERRRYRDSPPRRNFAPGATVNLSDVVISRQPRRADETSDSPSRRVCPGGPCPFAGAFGGGIFNAGTLTIRDSVISDNLAAGVASDADGGGIWSTRVAHDRELAYRRNSAVAAIPNGRFAEGGGLFVDGGSLSVRNSVVTGTARRSRAPCRSSTAPT